MLQKPKCQVIALEEHYWDKALAAELHRARLDARPRACPPALRLGELRLKEMDEAGIDVQVHLARRARHAEALGRRTRSR